MDQKPIEKRFYAQPEDFAVRRRDAIRKSVAFAQKNIPGFLGLGLFGSLARGESQLEKKDGTTSDIDAFLFIDGNATEALRALKISDIYKTNVKNQTPGYVTVEEVVLSQEKIPVPVDEFFDELWNSLKSDSIEGGSFFSVVLRDDIIEYEADAFYREVKGEVLRQRIIVRASELNVGFDPESVTDPIEIKKLVKYYLEESMRDLNCEMPLKRVNHPQFGVCDGLFTLDIGGKITPFRKLFLDKLHNLCETEEELQVVWNAFIVNLKEKDGYLNHSKRPNNEAVKYPNTFEDAYKLYITQKGL